MQTPLERTIEILGPRPFDNAARFRSVLLDVSGERSAFNTVLIHCVDAGIASRLVDCTEGFVLKSQMVSAIERLHNEFGTDRQLASEVVAGIAALAKVKPVSKPPVIEDAPTPAPPIEETKPIPSFDTQPLPTWPKANPEPAKKQINIRPPSPPVTATANPLPLGWIVGIGFFLIASVLGYITWRALTTHKDDAPVAIERPATLRLGFTSGTSFQQQLKLTASVERAEFAGTGTPTFEQQTKLNAATGDTAEMTMTTKFDVVDASPGQVKLKATIENVLVSATGLLEDPAQESLSSKGVTEELTFTDRGAIDAAKGKIPLASLELPESPVSVGQEFQSKFTALGQSLDGTAKVILSEWHSNRRCFFLNFTSKDQSDENFGAQPIALWVDIDTGQVVGALFKIKSNFEVDSIRLYANLSVEFSMPEGK